MHPTIVLLPLVASLLLLLLQDHVSAADDCEPARCGNLTIRYPFWFGSGNQTSSPCGHPAFGVSCSADGSVAALKGSSIHVLTINYTNNSLVASHNQVAGDDGVCRANFNMSSSIALSPFTISTRNRALCFLYNCNGAAPTLRGYVNATSSCSSTPIYAYLAGTYFSYSPPEIATGGCKYAYMPVLGTEAATMTAANYSRLLKDGFILEWETVTVGDCPACNASGGQCRYDNDTAEFSCAERRHRHRKHKQKLILVAMVFTSTSLTLACLVWIMYRRREKYILFIQNYTVNVSSIEEILRGYHSLVPKRYKYSEIKKITGSFKDKLGEGGYGMVFKGKLENGHEVAVKLLKGSKGNGEEFMNEVISIRGTSHVNVVNLLGFCLHGPTRALIYEYMTNGSLDKYIYSEESKMTIGWEMLKQIAIGIARGLEYLHRGCNTRIIHFDIKPHNILLDEDFCPKIADFGLAKLCHLKDSALSMAEARGTIGFIAPEVFSRGFGVVSTKSDVYSYGMMLLEMVGGRKNFIHTETSSHAYFPNCAYDRLVKDLQGHEVTCETEEIERQMTLVGLWCIQTAPGNRPSMSRVIEMLEKNINELEMPPKPFLSCPSEPPHFSS